MKDYRNYQETRKLMEKVVKKGTWMVSPKPPHEIHVNGEVYIDYSLFKEFERLDIQFGQIVGKFQYDIPRKLYEENKIPKFCRPSKVLGEYFFNVKDRTIEEISGLSDEDFINFIQSDEYDKFIQIYGREVCTNELQIRAIKLLKEMLNDIKEKDETYELFLRTKTDILTHLNEEDIKEKVKTCDSWEHLKEVIADNICWRIDEKIQLPDGHYKSSKYEFTIKKGKLHGNFKHWSDNAQLWVGSFYENGKEIDFINSQ
jgi:hypothetical protein